MLFKILLILLISFAFLFPKPSFAYDSLSTDNNKIGIHILFPGELTEAAKLVNSNGGDWGYVTIPLPENDYDLNKWQDFMDNAKELHLIPIIRLATQIDQFNTTVWEKPDEYDVIDSVNFLNSLNWPTRNRYVVIYNEVNRGDEWGGKPDALEYSGILDLAIDAFHNANSDFFVISAGLDNAAPDSPDFYINEYTFLYQLEQLSPQTFTKIDGIASHSYPNPGFTGTPSDDSSMSIHSFTYESDQINSYAGKDLPVFITETGWDKDKVGELKVAEFYKYAFENVWNDPKIVAVTPFLLSAGTGSFPKFSFISQNGDKNLLYQALKDLPKVKGKPQTTSLIKQKQNTNPTLPVKDFRKPSENRIKFQKAATRIILREILGIH